MKIPATELLAALECSALIAEREGFEEKAREVRAYLAEARELVLDRHFDVMISLVPR